MEGIGWRWTSTHNPNLEAKEHSSPENYVLAFFVTAMVMYAIGIV
jgi:hypothetical protein